MEDIFESYQSLLSQVDRIFSDIRDSFTKEVRCGTGCVDCCQACFDVSFVEAAYIVGYIGKNADAEKLERISGRCKQAELEIGEKLNSLKQETDRSDLIKHFSLWRVRCPLLGSDGLCELYDARPVTCRAYGLPTEIRGQGHVCGFSGFDLGGTYPTVKLDAIAEYLKEMSSTLARELADVSGGDAWAAKRFFIHDAINLKIRK